MADTTEARFRFYSAGLVIGTVGHILAGEAELANGQLDAALAKDSDANLRAHAPLLEVASQGVLRILGPMGSGKSHAVWHYLLEQEGPKLWFRVGRIIEEDIDDLTTCRNKSTQKLFYLQKRKKTQFEQIRCYRFNFE